jgi:adenylate kinase family enzyme
MKFTSSAERSIAGILDIRLEDARRLLADAQSKGLIVDGKSSHQDQVAAVRKMFHEMPLEDQMIIRNRKRQEDAIVSHAADRTMSSANASIRPTTKSTNKETITVGDDGCNSLLDSFVCCVQCLQCLIFPLYLFGS